MRVIFKTKFSRLRSRRLGSLLMIVILAVPARIAFSDASLADSPVPPDQAEFFETKVRPVLADSCLNCHGAKKQSSGLRLDSRAAILEGGLNGPSIVPGNADQSLLIQAVRWTHDDIKMPEKAKLPDASIEALAQWVRIGAPWPETSSGAAADQRAASSHWAFQPVKAVEPPQVKQNDWVRTPVDAFILDRLEKEGLQPSPIADRRVLIRRVTFDLIGLPPTIEEAVAFAQDKSPDAYERLIDRLLASPRYGERWGRHWLDVARYADTKGYVFTEERKYPYSYTYRDYVIQAFNSDKPYDLFIKEQIAADKLGPNHNREALAGMGFLTVGRRFLNDQQEIIDDRIDVVTRGLLGLTVTCARCHDHKFDPIPTEDYYSLHGVFASSYEPGELPEIPGHVPAELSKKFTAELAKAKEDVAHYIESVRAGFENEYRTKGAVFLQAAAELGFDPNHAKLEERAITDKLAPKRLRHFIARWRGLVENTKKGHDPVMTPWNLLSPIAEPEFAARAAEILKALQEKPDPAKPINPVVLHALASSPPSRLADVASRYGELLSEVEKRWEAVAKGGAKALPEPDWEAFRAVFFGEGGVLRVDSSLARGLMNTAENNRLTELKNAVSAVTVNHPGSPPRAMVMNDSTTLSNPYVFLRGNPGRRGKEVPRQFLGVLTHGGRVPFKHGSGRGELAEAIASKDNPLTARVLVNRVWHEHFGAGLVATPSDFGTRSDPPTHPELLDWLAADFMRNGWSIKNLHRRIMLSNTYRQTSDNRDDALAKDPLNRLVWKFNRRRLDFEAMRDALLEASGQLDMTLGGKGVPINEPPFSRRRTVYGFIDRQNLDGVYRTFDFATPDASSPRRISTIVPQQALFLMNSPFVIEQSKRLVASSEFQKADIPGRFTMLYGRLFGRAPSPEERMEGREFLDQAARLAKSPSALPTWRYGWGESDRTKHAIHKFKELPHWAGDHWQVSGKMPDDRLGFLQWHAGGGHPGHDSKHAAILRWTAPEDLAVKISGKLVQKAKPVEGNGVIGMVVSAKSGVLGIWEAHGNEVDTNLSRVEVKAGETIDFVVDPKENDAYDSFEWAPKLDSLDKPGKWAADIDFHGPRSPALTPWEEYVQVLFLTNEFVFVD